ncbi:PREDICTED: leucine-rich repeat-containing protein 48-like [Papilio xuthus]|uniref:Dynein axonemal assembly factor 1 homolog n=1 Tax=Papilio xuthus TaxID=66420 RepID=A0A194PW71_PAPXU|nr:PREDICTED: leucine-rich repeat-containing protein 48-like [Papilio xuthus]KPI97248.1 Leucine-rich repeat-containing protein 48 [Papilio xuthus]
MTEKKSLNSLIIHPDIEPGVIDNAMLTRCILEYGPTEEAGRLFAEEGVHLDEATIVRLEFQNILRIDHLWMLKSLTKLTLAHNLIEKIENLELLTGLNELDLSFNKIERIENLDALVNLEVLTLFHNKIRKLENLDTLTKLLVFSIGDNLIEDYKEMAYLRRFRFLRSVSFRGNPCCDDPMAYQFLKSALTKVTYLDYKIITEEERESGVALFRGLLRRLDEADEKAEKERIAKEEYEAKVEFYALSFVEYLSGPELLDSMFQKDPDGSLLLMLGGELLNFYEDYKEQYVETMAGLVEYAQGAYNTRQIEVKLFRDLVDNALADSVSKSKEIVKKFEEKKVGLVNQMNEVIAKFMSKQATLEELEPNIVDLGEAFNDSLYEMWKNLMTIEMQLYEQCEESRTQFAVNLTEMITKLLEVSRGAFGSWRESELVWSTRQSDHLAKLVGNKVLLGDATPELFEVMMDREAMMNLVAQSSDNHLRFIDAREDLLMTRANNWRDHLVSGTNDNEIKRNRDRILEINYFIDNQREAWTDMQMSMTEAVDPEAAALLGDDF